MRAARYRFTALPRGVYTLTFTLSGFQKITRTDVDVNAAFVATLDIRMAVGQIEESITVTGQSPAIDVRTTTVDVEHQERRARNIADLAQL